MRKLLATTLVAGLPAFALAAKTYDTSVNAFGVSPNDAGAIAGPALYGADFEAPYVLGSINGQQGWVTNGAGAPSLLVANANPAGGVQHLRGIDNPAVGSGTLSLGFTPALGAQPPGPSTLSIDVNISGSGGADYDVVPQAPTQGFLTARVKFFYGDADGDLVDGDILVLDDADGPGPGGLGFVATGAEYTPGVYKNLRVVVNPGANSIQYFYDNALIHTSIAGVFAGTAMEQVVVLHDNFQNQGETGDFDNLRVTPEPTSLLALGLGALVALRRRR